MTTRTSPSCTNAAAAEVLPRRIRGRLTALLLLPPAAMACEVQVSPAETAEEAGLVEVRTLGPGIQVEARYFGSNNFTGAPVSGYEANACLLLPQVAEALARVQHDLQAQGFGLLVYDCYRPVRSVQAFMDWAQGPDDPRQKARWYPRVDKTDLVPDYISDSSGHSRGATVDLTLLQCTDAGCEPLHMGTPFDLFDPLSSTDAPVPEAAQANRQRLLAAMQIRGFGNYPQEWWHYTLQPEPDPCTAYDVPVR